MRPRSSPFLFPLPLGFSASQPPAKQPSFLPGRLTLSGLRREVFLHPAPSGGLSWDAAALPSSGHPGPGPGPVPRRAASPPPTWAGPAWSLVQTASSRRWREEGGRPTEEARPGVSGCLRSGAPLTRVGPRTEGSREGETDNPSHGDSVSFARQRQPRFKDKLVLVSAGLCPASQAGARPSHGPSVSRLLCVLCGQHLRWPPSRGPGLAPGA